jgi:type II secretory pathway pseudopilin PulG
MSTTPPRGGALLNVLVVVSVLSIVGLAFLQRSSDDGGAAAAQRAATRAATCAEAARELLLSQFRAYGTSPTQLTLSTHINDQNVSSGHYNQFAIRSVTAVAGVGSVGLGVSDMSNRIARAGMGGQVYRIVVVCSSSNPTDAGAHQNEVEYLVRFGL